MIIINSLHSNYCKVFLTILMASCIFLINGCESKVEDTEKIIAQKNFTKENVKKITHQPHYTLDDVEKITNQDKLINILKNSSSLHIKKSAANKINDRHILIEIARNTQDLAVREAVARSIVNKMTTEELRAANAPETLSHMAKYHIQRHIREMAISKITDQEVLRKIAKKDPDDFIRRTAIYQINDQNILIELAQVHKTSVFDKSTTHIFNQLGKLSFSCNERLIHRFCDSIRAVGKLKLLLIEKDMLAQYGNLSLAVNDSCTSQDYGRYGLKTHVTYRQFINLIIKNRKGEVLIRKKAQGKDFPRSTSPLVGGYQCAEIDYQEICLSLLEPIDKDNKVKLMAKYRCDR